MTEQERKLMKTLSALILKLSEPEKEKTLAFIEGMAFKADLQRAAQESA